MRNENRNGDKEIMHDRVQQRIEERDDLSKKTDRMEYMLKLLLQHHRCEETEGQKREKVDIGETDSSTRSKQLDYQHQKESTTNTEEGPTLMMECKANKGTHRINMVINHTMRQKQNVFIRPIIYKVKNATC